MESLTNFFLGIVVILILWIVLDIIFPQLKKLNNEKYDTLIKKLKVFKTYLSNQKNLDRWFEKVVSFDPFFIIPDSSNFTKFKTFVHLCFDSDDQSIWYAFCHELAHVANEKYSHNKEFWTKKKKILQQSINSGIYTKQKHKVCSDKEPVYVNVNILDVSLGSL